MGAVKATSRTTPPRLTVEDDRTLDPLPGQERAAAEESEFERRAAAAAVPPVASTSSTTSTRAPAPSASTCTSRASVPYSRA
ncbi:MAG: hypothetical protein ABS52_02990 [Gemmatimonadetes bacterium SCN 70-22]|nr:MAG: hypothetical protein ABS52_02990 [Gemmatimonadetes bacterium SCN 70-22]